MNDSGVTVFVANSHSFFIPALSWKPFPVLNHPVGSWLDFHHWWMKCHIFFSWPALMHEFINCGCGLMGSLVFSDDISIHGELWKLWLTGISISPLMRNIILSTFFINSHYFAYLLQQACIIYPNHAANAFQRKDKYMRIANWLWVVIYSYVSVESTSFKSTSCIAALDKQLFTEWPKY